MLGLMQMPLKDLGQKLVDLSDDAGGRGLELGAAEILGADLLGGPQ